MPIDNLVLVTGAGATREVGGETPLPLMPDWAATLRGALDDADVGLAELVGIRRGQSGPEFEQAVGDFLTWQRVLPLAARYQPFGLDPAARRQDDVKDWHRRAEFRAAKVVEVLHRTLYEQFGGGRINPEQAKLAYGGLLNKIDFVGGRTITIATTNYDTAAEIALAELDLSPEIGAATGPGGNQILRPAGLFDRAHYGNVPVLHLHGAVGWWTQPDGTVRILPYSTPFGDYDGAPTVLLPDPQKNPALEPAVRALWEQFEVALGQATHVLVVGHSLHDPVLVDRLRRAARRTAVGLYVAEGAAPNSEEQAWVDDQLPGSTLLPIRFGPDLWLDAEALHRWMA